MRSSRQSWSYSKRLLTVAEVEEFVATIAHLSSRSNELPAERSRAWEARAFAEELAMSVG